MRNVFDQYSQQENRVTHALVTALAEEPKLLRDFVRWSTGHAAPAKKLHIVEQRLPGEPEPTEVDAGQRGLPDAWIYDDDTWCLLIESKVKASLTNDQLLRHYRTAEKRGFEKIAILALDVAQPSKPLPNGVLFRRWHEVYTWLKSKAKGSEWARRVVQYLEVAENRFREEGYMTEGNLTTFSGIPFSIDEPYNYLEAKRVLKLAMEELRKNKALIRELGMDPTLGGRPGITGKDNVAVWDYLRLKWASSEQTFTKYPHLTVVIHSDRLLVIVTVPHGIKPEFRRNLINLGLDGFSELWGEVNSRLVKTLRKTPGAAPWCEVIQRRYPTQRSAAIVDAKIEYDLRTAFPKSSMNDSVKTQPQWLQATYAALTHKRSNLQVAIGANFPYRLCTATSQPEIVDTIAGVWIACKPLLDVLLKGRQ